jgi:hypothetical protein
MIAKMDPHKERMEAKIDAWLEEMKAWWKETMASQEVTEACLPGEERANPSGVGESSGTPWSP